MDEVLIDIWTYTDLHDRFSISRVSNRWRQVALSATSLWTLMDLEYNHVRRLRNLLQRSGSSPLHLVLSVKKYSNGRAGTFGSSVNPPSLSFYNHRKLNLYDDYPQGSLFGQTSLASIPRLTSTYASFLSQKEFDGIVTRSATLDAFIGEGTRFYVTQKTLNLPMPYLKTLRLMAEGTATGSQSFSFSPTLTIEPILFPMFGKETPSLREVYFENIHAQWGDPIYKNLTKLRLSHPIQRATVPQILRILESCPRIANLQLKGCLQGDPPLTVNNTVDLDNRPVVRLSRMNYFHLEDSDSIPIVELLTSLSLPPLNHLYLVDPGYKCITDTYGRPLNSLLPTIGQPTDLMISGYKGHYTLQGMNRNAKVYDTSTQSNGISRWLYSTRCATANRQLNQFTFGPAPLPTNPFATAGNDNPSINQSIQVNPNHSVATVFNGWTATAVAVGIQPPEVSEIEAQLLHHTITSGDGSSDFIELLDQVSLGGVQFHRIERLEIRDGIYFEDTIYRDVLSRCESIQKLRFSYNKGLGILNAIVKQEHCPMLTDVYLCGIEPFLGSRSGQTIPSPTVLAEWVESRQEASSCRRLKKIVVHFFDRDDAILNDETRKRIENGLEDGGTFIWRSVRSAVTSMKQQWKKLVEDDDYAGEKSITDYEKEDIETPEDGKNEDLTYPFQSEWPLSLPGSVLGWNDGPW